MKQSYSSAQEKIKTNESDLQQQISGKSVFDVKNPQKSNIIHYMMH